MIPFEILIWTYNQDYKLYLVFAKDKKEAVQELEDAADNNIIEKVWDNGLSEHIKDIYPARQFIYEI